MATASVTCDVCGLKMPATDAKRDIGSERDLCSHHYREAKLQEALAERVRLQEWLDATHLKRLRELDTKIAALTFGLPWSE
jgi:hypothetical protein